MTVRYDFAPIEALFPYKPDGGQRNEPLGMAELLGSTNTNVSRYRRKGMPVEVADRLAVRLGLHPAQLWPSWFDDAEDELRDAERLAEWWARLDRYRKSVVMAEAA